MANKISKYSLILLVLLTLNSPIAGLVMMALINNWDPKQDNNAIRERQGVKRAYYVCDLGCSFGRTGSTRSLPMHSARPVIAHSKPP